MIDLKGILSILNTSASEALQKGNSVPRSRKTKWVLGFASILSCSSRPKLVIQVHSPAVAKDCEAFLKEFGYEISMLEKLTPGMARDDAEICHFIGWTKHADGT